MQDHFVLFLALTSPFSTNVNPHQLRHGGFEAHAPGHHGGTEEADRRRQRPGGQPLQLSGSHAWHAGDDNAGSGAMALRTGTGVPRAVSHTREKDGPGPLPTCHGG